LRMLDGADRARIEQTAAGKSVAVRFDDDRTIRFEADLMMDMIKLGWIGQTTGETNAAVSLTEDGRTYLARLQAGSAFADQHRQLTDVAEIGRVQRNHAESPLNRLAHARGGRVFIDKTQLAAGERLRADFEHAQLRQRVTASWDQSHVAQRGVSPPKSSEPTDRALDARARFHAALDAVGPEFAGVLVDVCCFLKGLEQVESERGWPRRSAKVLLGAALQALDRHYNPPPEPRRVRQRHWGSDDYRPDLQF